MSLSSTPVHGIIEQALDDVHGARRSVVERIDADTPAMLRRRIQVTIDDLDATERDLLLALTGNDTARADTVVDVRRSLEEVDVMSRRWFAQLRDRTSEIEEGPMTPTTSDVHLELDETESELALDRALDALTTESDLVRARHIAARAIDRVRVRLRDAATTVRERAD